MQANTQTQNSGALVIPRKRYELPGGAVLLVSHRPKAPVTAAKIYMHGGIILDEPGKEGTAEWSGRMVQQGTASKDEAAIAECIEPYGGSVSANANGISGNLAGDQWRQLLDVMFELASQPSYPDEAIQVQLARAKSHLSIEEEDPRVQGGRLFRRLVYGQNRLAMPSEGTLATLSEITPDHMRKHHAQHWCSARAIIAVCGDVEADTVYEHVLGLMGDWNVGSALPDYEPGFPARGVRAEAFEKGREQVHIYYGHLGVRRNVAEYPALVVMDHVLGSGPGFVNRLSKKLRDEQGLAYSVHGSIHHSAGWLTGMFSAYIGTSPEHIEQAVRGIQKEVRSITEEPVSEEELAMAKSYVTGSMVLGYERASRRAASLVHQEVHGFAEDHLEQLRSDYAAITAEDVLAAAKKHLYPDAACLAAAGSVNTAQLAELMG